MDMIQSDDTLVITTEVAMPKDKYPSQSSSYRVNVYLDPDDQVMFAEIADLYAEAGIDGMRNEDGTPIKSAIVRRLMMERLGKVKRVKDPRK
jgi:hypothetical protein